MSQVENLSQLKMGSFTQLTGIHFLNCLISSSKFDLDCLLNECFYYLSSDNVKKR